MSDPRSCTKCGNLLAVASASGLCPECAPAAEPATHTFPAAPPAPDTPNAAADPTPPAPPADPDPHAPTRTAPSDAVTASAPAAPDGAADPLPPDPVGYTLIARIGRGGMGEVFRAHEHSTNRFVALKTMDPKRATGAHFERFQLEFCALANIEHPHIVRVFRDDFHHKPPFFTMEELEGGTVSARLRREDPDDPPVRYAPRAAVELIRKVASAVQALHDYRAHGCLTGVVHRDIKPGNILLTAKGEPKLADFGLVKYLDAETITPADVALGTPAYMPPEQCAGQHAEIGYAADVYGLGATLYHMLTGEPPFRGTLAQIVAQVQNKEPKPVCELAPEVDVMLGRIVRACMHKRPKDRYQTVRALIADLDAWLNPTPEKRPTPPEPSIGTRAGRWAKRNAIALAACALLALAGGAVALWPQPDPLADVQSVLQRGRPVVLIGEREPRWCRWVVGNPEFERNPPTGGGGAFNTTGTAMLELLPNPYTDRYQLTVELAQFAFADAKTGFVGLYFCAQKHEAGEGARLLYTQTVWFTDQPNKPQRLNFGPFGIAMVPLKWDAPYKAVQASGEHLPGSEGPWRRIEVEVDPEGITVSFQGQVHRFSSADVARHYDEATPDLSRMLGRKPPELQLPAQRGSLGVIALGCRVGVRRVTITPLPLAE